MKFLTKVPRYVFSIASEFHHMNHSRNKVIVKMVRLPINNIP
jgi:hypothetical protein